MIVICEEYVNEKKRQVLKRQYQSEQQELEIEIARQSKRLQKVVKIRDKSIEEVPNAKDEVKRLEKMLETKPEEPVEVQVVDHKKGGMKKKALKFL